MLLARRLMTGVCVGVATKVSNPFRPGRPAVLDVHELVHGQARQRDADRLLLGPGLTHRRAPGDRQIPPAVGAVRRPVMRRLKDAAEARRY